MFLDVQPARPAARPVALAGGVVSLALPLSRAEAETVARAYFRAFEGGDFAAFVPLLLRGARRLDDGGATDLAAALERRLRSIDYSRLSADAVAVYDAARIVPFEDASGEERRACEMHDGEVLIDVPMRVERASGVRVFGPRVVLVVRHVTAPGGWQIAAVRELDGPWS
jgi:hypothetical protein